MAPWRSGRRRPVQERGRRMVDAIMAAGLELVQESGPGGLSTRRIAERAGVSVGALYQYFANKDEVLELVYRRQLERDLESLESWLRGHRELPLRDVVRVLLGLMVDRHRQLAELPGFDARHPAARSLATFNPEGWWRLEEIFRETLEAHRDELRARRIDDAIFFLSWGLPGILRAAVERSPERLRDPGFTAELVDLVTRYLLWDES